jgi:anaerobic magnesium-protoporphyrin IX monomethyl ester cyclase
VKFAAEIAWLVREHGVELVNLADENPTSSRKAWKAFLEALVATGVKVTLIGSTRADDIVRDADLLPLYKRAGCLRFLLGLEGTDEATLATVRKGGTRAKDREAIGLLRAHGMIGLCTFAWGLRRKPTPITRGCCGICWSMTPIRSCQSMPHRTAGHRSSGKARIVGWCRPI